MKTKFLSVIAAIAIAMTSFVSLAVTASAEEVEWLVTGNEISVDIEAELPNNLVIPAKVGSTTITAISSAAFANHWELETVTIEDGIETIGDSAFDGCENLKTVTIPASVNEIGEDAFFSCENLKNIIFMGTEDAWNVMTGGKDIWGLEMDPQIYFNGETPGDNPGGDSGDEPTDYTLTCNGEPIEVGATLKAGDVIATNLELWVYLEDIDNWLCSGEGSTYTLPKTFDKYTLTTIDEDYLPDEIDIYIKSFTDETEVGPEIYTLTCNGNPIQEGDYLSPGDVIKGNTDLVVHWDFTGTGLDVYTDDDGKHEYTMSNDYAKYVVTWVEFDYEDEKKIFMNYEPCTSVSSVTLTESAITLVTGETSSLSATVAPEDAYDKSLTWTSSDNNVATVDENGNVTAIGVGTATVTATSKMESSVSATCNVTVTNPASSAEIAVVDKDAYIDGDSNGYLRILTRVTFPAEKAVEYYGTWFIPADLHGNENYSQAEVKLNNADNAIESGNIFASDLRYIPSDKHKTAILAIPFVKLIGEENLATTSVEASVLENLNETSSNK
ncbi:MAG: leucine-rich repeat protein [Clostridia bacterium]|nr:leucine-rich repeat protein [Clostridia bacterium]